MGSQPLEQWQIDHILKMQQELGLPDTEEVTMDEDMTGENPQGSLPSAADAAAGALSVYKNPNVQKAQTAYDALAKEQLDRYNALQKALEEKRYGPSFSERMFQLSAALAQPTTRRGFGGVLENITPVLAAQEKAQREGKINRQEALEQLQSNRIAAQMGLAKQDLTTQLAMAKLEAMKSNKPRSTASPITVGPDMVPRSRLYGTTIKEPPQPAIYTLQAYLADPNASPQDKMIARRNFDTRFGYGAAEIFGGEQ